MPTVIYVYIYDFTRKHDRSLNVCSNIPDARTVIQLVTKCLKKRQVMWNVVEYSVIYLGENLTFIVIYTTNAGLNLNIGNGNRAP